MDSIELLRKIVAIDSTFPKELELAHFLSDQLKELGLGVRMQEFDAARYNLLAEKKGNGRPILLYAHMDTVPPYGYAQEGRDPHVLEEKEGKLYGLGVYDMKAGIAAILKALEQIEGDNALKVMFVSDEEADSRGCYEVTKTDFLQDVGFAISTEMSDVSDLNEKARMITVGRRGRVQYEIDVPGRSVHAAHMKEGISAVTEASKLAIELDQMNEDLPRHEKFSHADQYVRHFDASSISLSLPDNAKLWVDRHLIATETTESALKDMQDRINALYTQGILRQVDGKQAMVRVRPRSVPYMMPYLLPEDNPHVARMAQAIRDALGVEPRYNCGLTVADENMIAMQGIPIITYGPIGGGEHSVREWVSKKSYLEIIDVLQNFIGNSQPIA